METFTKANLTQASKKDMEGLWLLKISYLKDIGNRDFMKEKANQCTVQEFTQRESSNKVSCKEEVCKCGQMANDIQVNLMMGNDQDKENVFSMMANLMMVCGKMIKDLVKSFGKLNLP